MAELNNYVGTANDIFFVVNESSRADDGLADDDSWVENISQNGDDLSEFETLDEAGCDAEDKISRGYGSSALDFTLHTIVEESCEETELEHLGEDVSKEEEENCSNGSRMSPSYLEKYFFFGLGDGVQSNAFEESSSEIFSDCSDNQDAVATNIGFCDKKTATELSTSRLEKYFLSGFMGFSGETKSDGSVGSDSEGHPSPSQRKKKYVRARGTQRSNNSSLDNLIVETVELTNEQSTENLYSSESETGSLSEPGAGYDKAENGDITKRKKNYRKREIEQKQSNECSNAVQPANKKKTSSISEHSDVDKRKDCEVTGMMNLQTSLPKTSLIRKDSFNNWSSDEETNLMMSKMRQFFKTLIAVTSQNNSQTNKFGTYSGNFLKEKPLQRKNKPFQISYFENELVRLMKTVPGINNQQVREIVEYFSSEDAWSDSNDSSDCNRPNSDAIHKKLRKPSSMEPSNAVSARVSVLNDDWIDEHCAVNSDNVLLYTDLIESLIKTNTNFNAEKATVDEESHNHICTEQSPQLLANVMQHIGRKLVALMHDVKIGSDIIPVESSELSRSNDITNPEENSTKSMVDHIDCSSSRRGQLPRSQSHDVLLGSSNPSWLFNSNNAVNENAGEVSDCDRFSWRGSFESALLAPVDSGSKLLNFDRDNCSLTSDASIAKRGSADNITYTIIKSKEQLDRVQSCGSIGGGDNQSASEAKPVWQSSLTDIKLKNELEKDVNRIHIEGNISTNSLPRLQSIQFSSEMPDKSISDSNVVQCNAKSARYRSPVAPIAFPKSLSKRNTFQPSTRPYQLSSLQRGMTASASLDDFSISEFSISKSPELERNKLYRRNNTNFGVRSDSLTSVYSDNFENRFGNVKVKGQIEFGMQYNYKISALEIHIIKCKDLAIADVKRNKSDPYVKAYLLPDKSKSGKRKTKVKKNTLNPVFDEVIRFFVSISDLKTRSIWLTVWHSDIFGRNEFLGQVVIDLQEKVFDNPQSQWYTLQEKSRSLDSNSGYNGDLVVGLKFVTAESTQANKTDCAFVRRKESVKSSVKGQLHILVKEAKNLRSPRTSGTCDTFCKSYLLPNRTRSSKQKTPVVKKSLNPVWNCTFVYDNVTLQDLSERALELTVWDHDRLISNHLLGGVRFSLGSEKQGKKINWMDSQGKELFLWQEMINRPNFWVEGSVNLRLNLELKTEENNEC